MLHSVASAARALAECGVVGDHCPVRDSIPGKGRGPRGRALTETLPECRFTQAALERCTDPLGGTRVKAGFSGGHQLAEWRNVADENWEPGVERLENRQSEALCQGRENGDRSLGHDVTKGLVGDLTREDDISVCPGRIGPFAMSLDRGFTELSDDHELMGRAQLGRQFSVGVDKSAGVLAFLVTTDE